MAIPITDKLNLGEIQFDQIKPGDGPRLSQIIREIQDRMNQIIEVQNQQTVIINREHP